MRRSSKEGNLDLFDHRLIKKKKAFTFTFCSSLLSSSSSDGEGCLSLLEKIPG